MIYTIGDSHAGGVDNLIGAFDKIHKIKKNWLGPRLMYSISLEGIDLNKLGVLSGDTVILCFGEIDCRCHVHKHIQTLDFKKIIDILVDNYFHFIKKIIIDYNVKVCVYNVVPPVRKEMVQENTSYPFLGTNEERKSYVTYMNSKLKEECNKNNLLFIDIYKDYICEDGFLKKEMSDGNVHIVEHTSLEDFLKKNNII